MQNIMLWSQANQTWHQKNNGHQVYINLLIVGEVNVPTMQKHLTTTDRQGDRVSKAFFLYFAVPLDFL